MILSPRPSGCLGTSEVRFPHMTTKAREVHHYDVNFSDEGPKLDVRRTRVTTE